MSDLSTHGHLGVTLEGLTSVTNDRGGCFSRARALSLFTGLLMLQAIGCGESSQSGHDLSAPALEDLSVRLGDLSVGLHDLSVPIVRDSSSTSLDALSPPALDASDASTLPCEPLTANPSQIAWQDYCCSRIMTVMVTVLNPGGCPASVVNSITVDGLDGGVNYDCPGGCLHLVMVPDLPKTLAPNDAFTFGVSFFPPLGSLKATAQIVDAAGGTLAIPIDIEGAD